MKKSCKRKPRPIFAPTMIAMLSNPEVGIQVKQWKESNRDQYNEYQRQYRAKRKAEGNPIHGGA